MAKYVASFFALITFITLLTHESYSQAYPDSLLYSVETLDGNEYIGKIISVDHERLTLLTENLGEIKIFTKDLKRIKEVSKMSIKEDGYWFENPQAARYFWAPNGYGLKKRGLLSKCLDIL
jgi:hypothetical protein